MNFMAATTILLLLLTLLSTATSSSSSPDEQLLLLAFKSSLHDQASPSLSDWSPSSPTHHCNWTGVACTPHRSVSSLDLPGLNLSGDLPPSLCSLPSLSRLDLSRNLFSVPLPLHLSLCPSLLLLNLSSNLLWGPLPDRLPPSLTSLDLSHNPSISSQLPPDLGTLTNLKSLRLHASGIHGHIPADALLRLRSIQLLDLSRNNLTGPLPANFGSGLPALAHLDLSQNNLSGPFPADVCAGNSLVELSLYENSFAGPVPPAAIQRCSSLERLQVQSNRFAGDFPSALWSLPRIRLIRAEDNRFTGRIPASVARSASLEQVQIDSNEFSGEIPPGLGSIPTMYRFSAPNNGFYGRLPDDFCGSPALSILDVSRNSLSGPIPELANCTGLVSLSLAGNGLTGGIPRSLGRLQVLTYIDLSSNNLTGGIPEGLQGLKLALLNVSFNRLSGAVPLPLIAGLPASFLQGNPGLCGPGLPNACDDGEGGRGRTDGLTVAVVATAFAVGFVVLVLGFFGVYRLYRKDTTSDGWKSVFFYPLGVSEDDLITSLDEKRAIGRGPLGNVHSFQLPGGGLVAVKKLLNPGNLSLRTAKAEIGTLAKARHKNLTRVLGFCYSESALLLVHDYHRRGSVGDVLRSSGTLEWGVRLRIALGTARGLAYLHKDYVPHLLHRNLKSNNVLLDDDFEPKITGFGLDRVVGDASYRLPMAHESEARCYIAPEHGYSKKTTEQMDIYSFGVLLLELITGREAERQESREAPDIVKWVRRKVNMTNGPLEVLDPKISSSSQQEMLGALDLALRCTSVMPEKRPASDEVVRSLESLHSVVNPPEIYSGELPISS
ncbi:putative inactive leucine-rich repeat receptor-like protein kinase [Iris pallida]|uniref:Inactive leucine-rich repeat receptor-like protein kinase n=1 Tax=Iris pallida TaxID=29817 RepID=A0AAX6HVV1_IRIPA|nr:putative inactive leucine-rich repeat receptor-like protein kinase [Iris pallida]